MYYDDNYEGSCLSLDICISRRYLTPVSFTQISSTTHIIIPPYNVYLHIMGIYTSFSSAADNLVTRYDKKLFKKIKTDQSVILLLFARLEKLIDMQSPASTDEPAQRFVFSHLEDKMGDINECGGHEYTLLAPQMLLRKILSPGVRVMIEVVMAIKPHNINNGNDWPIKYRSGDGTYWLGFRELIFIEQI